MYCPNCGSEMNGTTCPICGSNPTSLVSGGALSATSSELAGWWRRVGATVVDNLALFAVFLLLALILRSTLAFILFELVTIGYFIRLFSLERGQTLGNRAAGTQVRNAATGGALSVQQAAYRWAGQFLPSLVVGLSGVRVLAVLALIYGLVDYLFPLWDSRNQTIHDKLANTVVVIAPATL
jgi:uncharacterized RDD family membrane protein YckC